ncbi:hypothetical protein CBR_g5634 [Chara braunii]|uniref:Uncharacterized protein n=1 Tax=Chara braunii TaxID=69332 RepID=A0A388JRQ9_CHABU|nr:hypothetical protein CBR_g5634 [Chara braunii]|eukprot:GBG60460.1 hypothetical protein CBR_g5634 [Chara braunii]
MVTEACPWGHNDRQCELAVANSPEVKDLETHTPVERGSNWLLPRLRRLRLSRLCPLRFRPRIGKVTMRPSSPARPQTTTTELCAIGLVPSIVPGEVQVPSMTRNARAKMWRAVIGMGRAVVRRGRAVVRGTTVMKEMLKARADTVNEARGALTGSQKARTPLKTGGGWRSGSRGGGRGGGRKGSQRSRAPELRDSGDEGEGVGPRMPEDIEELIQHAAPLDTRRCFFLEYDEQGFARQDVHVVNVDVTRIKPIPRGRILFNHRSLSENIVRGIESAIESSISADPGVWDRPELVLAPVDPNVIVSGQGRRITPDEFLQRDSAEFDWYAVCGQHTAEAMKRLVAKDSPAVKVYGLRAYKDWSNKLRGYLNLATSTRTVWPLVEKFFAMFEEGKLPINDDKIPLEMSGRMEGRLPGPYTDESKGQRTLYHCIYVKDGPKGSTVSWKDLCPTYFKNFGDMTCREREVALLLLLSGKVVATKVRVAPPRVNTECLLDIMRKERYMVRMFNYVVFRVEKLHSNLVKTIPWRLEGVEEARQGAGLGPTEVMYKEAPFHFKVFIYTVIDTLDMLRAEVKRIASSARHLVWDKLGRQTTLLSVCMQSKEVMAAPVDIFAAAQKMACKAAIVDISAANFSSAWTSQDFNALYAMMAKCCGPNWVLFFFAPQNVQSYVLRQLYRWEDIELIPGSWKRVDRPSRDITRYGNIATISRDLMTIVLHAEGGDLKKVNVAPRLLNDLTEVHVVEEKFGKCLGKHGGVEGDEGAAYSIWEREPDKLRKLCSSFVGEAEGVFLLGRAHAGLVWKFLLAGNNVIACDESAKDIAYLTKFIDILVKDGKFECRLEKPRATYRTNRDMYHKLGSKRLKGWEYLFRDAPDGRLDGGYIYRKAKVTEALKHYHGALTGAFETFVARCEILRFDLHKDQLTFKDYADLTKSGEGFNPIDSEEDSSGSDLEIENDTNATGWCGQSAAMEHSIKGYRPGQSEGCSNMPPANSVASWVDRVLCTPVEEDEDDDLDILAQPTKLAPGDPIPPSFCADPNTVYFLDDKYTCTSEDKWGHDIIWHDGIFESCIQGGEWKKAVKYLKYSHKLYELQSSPSYGKIDWKVERAAALESMDVDSREDVAPVPEAATGNTMGEQREDGGRTLGVKPLLPEAGNTHAGKNTIRVIYVVTGDTSQGEQVSLDKPADAGVTYGSLLATRAALAGTSEMESKSTVGMGVTGMSLHPPTCTSKGDAHCTTTP